MALGENYATRQELKDYLKVEITGHDDQLDDALSSSSREIEKFCGRQFNDSESESTRVYSPLTAEMAVVDDFHTDAGLVVETDEDDDGDFDTTWDSSEYVLHPLNGIRDGVPGWPFWHIKTTGDRLFCPQGRRYPYGLVTRRPSLRVTARWGWAEVPAPVKQSCLILAAETFKLAGAPLGVASFNEFGVIRVRQNTFVQRKLNEFRRGGGKVA